MEKDILRDGFKSLTWCESAPATLGQLGSTFKAPSVSQKGFAGFLELSLLFEKESYLIHILFREDLSKLDLLLNQLRLSSSFPWLFIRYGVGVSRAVVNTFLTRITFACPTLALSVSLFFTFVFLERGYSSLKTTYNIETGSILLIALCRFYVFVVGNFSLLFEVVSPFYIYI